MVPFARYLAYLSSSQHLDHPIFVSTRSFRLLAFVVVVGLDVVVLRFACLKHEAIPLGDSGRYTKGPCADMRSAVHSDICLRAASKALSCTTGNSIVISAKRGSHFFSEYVAQGSLRDAETTSTDTHDPRIPVFVSKYPIPLSPFLLFPRFPHRKGITDDAPLPSLRFAPRHPSRHRPDAPQPRKDTDRRYPEWCTIPQTLRGDLCRVDRDSCPRA